MKVLLFDVDSTLISAGGAGRRAIEQSFLEVVGAPGAFGFSFGGMTDPGIIRKALTSTDLAFDDAVFDRVVARYLELLRVHVNEDPNYSVLPGVVELLDALAQTSMALGLGTGNVESGARIKLERGQLNHHFSFGGFGCDHEDRTELIRAGYERGLSRIKGTAALLVIGDTPRDVSAAHAVGGRCLAVATGGYSAQDLQTAGADWVVESLDAPEVLAIISA